MTTVRGGLVAAVAAILWVSAPAFAQGTAAVNSTCAYEFGNSEFSVCVSPNGNIVRLTSPAGAEHINVGTLAEGYVLCAGTHLPYYDVAAAGARFGAPTLLDGPTSDSVTIQRTTGDGLFTVQQAFVANTTNRQITVTMTIINNGPTVSNVRLLRSADFDMDGTRTTDVFDRSNDSTWARQLRAASLSAQTRNVPHQARISPNLAPQNCGPATVAPPTVNTDLASFVRYDIGSIPARGNRAVRFRYQIF